MRPLSIARCSTYICREMHGKGVFPCMFLLLRALEASIMMIMGIYAIVKLLVFQWMIEGIARNKYNYIIVLRKKPDLCLYD